MKVHNGVKQGNEPATPEHVACISGWAVLFRWYVHLISSALFSSVIHTWQSLDALSPFPCTLIAIICTLLH